MAPSYFIEINVHQLYHMHFPVSSSSFLIGSFFSAKRVCHERESHSWKSLSLNAKLQSFAYGLDKLVCLP